MPHSTSMGSYVDVDLDNTGPMNGSDTSLTQSASKYVTFDEGSTETRTFDEDTSPFTGPGVSVPKYSAASHTSGMVQQHFPSQADKQQCLTMEPPKLERLKNWTVQSYKYTKQLVTERMGHSTRTFDKELEERIVSLRVTREHYSAMLKECSAMLARFDAMVNSHRNIRSQFQTLISISPELQDQLQANATTMSILEKNGEGLLGAIKSFNDSLNTLVNYTIQDTLQSIKHYETSRIEYDAYRNDIESLRSAPQTEANANKMLEYQVIFEIRKKKWESLKSSVNTKLDLLNEHKLNVLKVQLEMFNAAIIAYFTGNGDKLSEVLSEYHIKARKHPEEDPTLKSKFATQND